MEQVLSENGSILGLRELAKELSSQLKIAIDNNTNIILDFSNVESISSSFADELIAKVLIEVGIENFLKNVKIRNANTFIKTMINSSINDRLNDTIHKKKV